MCGQSVNSSNASLEQFLSKLSEIHGINFSYSDPLVKGKQVSGSCSQDLVTCLKNKLFPMDIDFTFVNQERVALFPMEIKEINGFILDSLTHEPLIGAHIYNTQISQGTITDENGYFRLFSRRIDSIYQISYIGYQGKVIYTNSYLPNQWFLAPKALDPIVVLGKDLSYISKYVLQQDELQLLNARLFEQLPSLGAEPDIMQYASQSPGIYLGTDGVSGLRVRGGSTDQNLISIDEIPIYYPYHIIGYKSILNTSDVSQVSFHKSGFNGTQQGRLSSFFNIESRDPGLKRMKLQGAVGTPFIVGSLELPLIKNQTAIRLRARNSVANQIIRDLSKNYYNHRGIDGQKEFRFNDLLIKLVHRSKSGSDLLKAMFLSSQDNFFDESNYQFEDKEEYIADNIAGDFEYRNEVGYIHWAHYFQNNWEVSSKLYTSNYDYISKYKNDYLYELNQNPGYTFDWRYNLNFKSKLKEFGLKHAWNYSQNQWNFKFGINASLHSYNTQFKSIYQEDVLTNPQSRFEETFGEVLMNNTWNNLTYLSVLWTKGTWDLNFNLGYNYFKNHSYSDSKILPRLSIQRLIKKKYLIFLHADRNIQNQHVLALSYSGLPNEIWVPANEYVPSQESTQATLGIKTRLKKYYFSVEIYHKWLEEIIDLSDQAISLSETVLDNISVEFWDAYVDFGNSRNIGLEINTQFQNDLFYTQLNYTLSSAIRQFDSKYRNLLIDYEYNPRHQIAIQSIFSPHPKWSMGISWVYTSNNAIPLVEGSYDIVSGNEFIEQIDVGQNDIELYYLPTFHKMNLSVNYSSTGKYFKHEAKVSVSNLYNLINYTHYKIFNQSDATSSFATVRLFESLPILPTIYYRIIF